MEKKKSNFEIAHEFTKKWEGGLVDHPDDPGGITNYGISIRFLKEQRPEDDITPTVIRNLTEKEAKSILKNAFWDSQELDKLPLTVAIAHYDFSVNGGISQATKILQRNLDVKDDGVIGPITRGAIESFCKEYAPIVLAHYLCDSRRNFYENLANQKKKFTPFLKGWFNRVNALDSYLEKVNEERIYG